jgi:DNA-binding NarL/FixJ family response regulator
MLPQQRSSRLGSGGGTGNRAEAEELTVVVVDDHATFADLLALGLEHEPGLACVGTATIVSVAQMLVDQLRPDVVIMDVKLGDEDGIDATAELVARYPDLRVVVLTAHLDSVVVQRAASAGACCLLPKNGSLIEVLHGLRVARPGGLMVAPAVLKGLMSNRAPRDEVQTQVPLSEREHQVLCFLGEGVDVHRIAALLGSR